MRRSIHEYVDLEVTNNESRLVCVDCGADLGSARDNYRDSTIVQDSAIASLGELYGGMGGALEEEIVFRTYNCPGCGRRLDAEICPRSAVPVRDVEIANP